MLRRRSTSDVQAFAVRSRSAIPYRKLFAISSSSERNTGLDETLITRTERVNAPLLREVDLDISSSQVRSKTCSFSVVHNQQELRVLAEVVANTQNLITRVAQLILELGELTKATVSITFAIGFEAIDWPCPSLGQFHLLPKGDNQISRSDVKAL